MLDPKSIQMLFPVSHPLRHRGFEILRFAAVGLLRSILGFGLIFVLYNLFHVHYILSNIAGYLAGFIAGFFLHKTWTFKSKKHWNRELTPYLIMFGIGYGVNFVLLLLCINHWHLNPNLSQLIAVLGFTSVNYLGNSLWTFRHKSSE